MGLAAVTVVLRLPAYLAGRHLTFDDGVFGASAVAMRHGGKPFAEVFSSQGPLFLPLVWVFDAVGGRTASSPRLLAVVAGAAFVLVTYAIGRIVADRPGALLAGGLAATSVGLLGVTSPLAADGPALAFGAVGIALALRWRDDPSVGHAVAIGLAVGAALSVKSLVAPMVVPVALVLLGWRRLGLVAAAAGTSVALHGLIGAPWGWADVWDQSYAYHLDVAGDRTPIANLAKTVGTLADRELPLLVAAALTVLCRLRRLRGGRPDKEDVLLLAWLGATLAVLLLEHPMWRPHVAYLVAPAALLVARHRPPWRLLAIAAVPVVPYHVVHAWHLLAPDDYAPETAAVVERIAELPEGALAISDEPGLVWRAGRRTTDDLVDASILRIETERITVDSLAAAAADPDVCAVAVRSRARWGSFDDLPERLADAGFVEALVDDRGRALYVKEPCRPERPR